VAPGHVLETVGVSVQGSTPREWRLTFWLRSAARRAKAQLLAWNPERLIVAHGMWARQAGREVVETGLAWL
jgi:hypothetical protein